MEPMGLGLLHTLIYLANKRPELWSNYSKDSAGDRWMHHPQFEVDPNNRGFVPMTKPQMLNLQQRMYGSANPDVKALTYHFPDENGPGAMIFGPQDDAQTYQHELKHTRGYLHPDQELMNLYMKYRNPQ